MTVRSTLRHRCDTARNQAVGTNGRKQYQTNLTSVRCMFVPMSDRAAIENNYSVGFAWDVYFEDGTDVQIGDKLTTRGTSYIVRGRKPFADFGTPSYLQVAAETENANGQ